jgi:ABC-type Zn uptake system ZnuABC Zn-binding protein ZnuA
MRFHPWALSSLLIAALAAGCGSDSMSGGTADAELTAVATTTQLGDMVSEVGGERVAVEQILEPNADPHDYEPRPSDAQALADAGVVFKSGGDLDEWLDELVESAGGEAEVVEALEAVRTIEGEGHGHEAEEHAGEDHADEDDPHWWQDPRNAARVVEAIRDTLVEADPEGREAYESNASGYIDRLDRLDRAVASCIEQIPPGQRQLVTTHDALGYYADRYGLEVVGAVIPSLSTQAQPSAGDTADLVDQIERLDVEAIFPESSLSPDVERAIAREAGAEVGGALWADTLGPEDSSGATYVESIEANTATIVEGLSGGEASCSPSG